VILLVDLSNHQKHVNVAALRRAGIKGGWHKATEGASFHDALFGLRRAEFGHHGLRFGAYHFAQPGEHGAYLQADVFSDVVDRLERHDLRPVLDLEATNGLAAKKLETWARLWCQRVKHNLGVWPLVYSYPAFLDGLGLRSPIGGGLWLASYDRNDGKEHPYRVPPPWRRAVAHQFSSRSMVAGVEGLVDLSSAPRLQPLLAHPMRGLV